MKYKNYYKLLGLKGPKVTDEEIKIAYRKLAKKYHPDIHPNDVVAQEKFKDVNEAYQTLTDEDARIKYNFRYYAHSLKDKISLSNIKLKLNKSGFSEFTNIFVGNSISTKSNDKGEDLFITIELTLQEAFNGVTKQIQFKADDNTKKSITVKIPRGMNNGSNIRLQGQGKKSNYSETPGDLFIITQIKEDARFKLLKNNLCTELSISPAEAVLGNTYHIESIDSTYTLKVEPGTLQGQKHTVKDAGYIDKNGKRGDLIVTTNIEIPKQVSKEEKELYIKLFELQKQQKTP